MQLSKIFCKITPIFREKQIFDKLSAFQGQKILLSSIILRLQTNSPDQEYATGTRA